MSVLNLELNLEVGLGFIHQFGSFLEFVLSYCDGSFEELDFTGKLGDSDFFDSDGGLLISVFGLDACR